MAFDFRQFAADYGVRYYTDGYKQCGDGWLQIMCPFCSGSGGPHLGYNKGGDYFNCWRCGGHNHAHVIHGLLSIPYGEAKDIFNKYKSRPGARTQVDKKARVRARDCLLPKGTGPMQGMHNDYLASRGYDAAAVTKQWWLQGTGHLGEYKFRIIIPVYYNGALVTYQGRDITDKSMAKYLGCHKEAEVLNQKEVLYGLDDALDDSVVIVEGPMDVWRLGPGAVATFGIDFKPAQVALLQQYTNKYICFDTTEPQALKQAEKLAAALSVHPGNTEVITIDADDPAEMAQTDADKMMEELIGVL